MFGIYGKEMRAYFVSPIPYILLVIFSAWMALWFFEFGNFFFRRVVTFEAYFHVIPFTFIILIPAISMRLWSEEKRGGTDETLMTLPVSSWQLVGGKYLAALTLLAILLAATVPIAYGVSTLGDFDWGPVFTGFLGTFLLGAAFLAMGIWFSFLTGHQIVAFLLTAVVALALILLNVLLSSAAANLGWAFLEPIAISTRFEAIGRGVIDFRDVLYFLSFSAFFLYLNAVSLKIRRFS